MIESTKTQNAIVVATILIGVFSGVGLVSSTSFYSGSINVVASLDIDLQDILIANLDPTNESVNPALVMVFSVKAPQTGTGQMTLTFLRASVNLNNESLSYTSFQNFIVLKDRSVTPGYDRNLTVGSTILSLQDKQLLYNASEKVQWTFSITLFVFYHVFQSRAEEVRILVFAHEGYTDV